MSPPLVLALAIIVVGGFRDPLATPAPRDGLVVLARLRDRRGRGRSDGACDDRPLASRPCRGRPLLDDPRLLTGDPRLPLLHAHRPEDGPCREDGAVVFGVSVALLAALLVAVAPTEFWAKVAVLGGTRRSSVPPGRWLRSLPSVRPAPAQRRRADCCGSRGLLRCAGRGRHEHSFGCRGRAACDAGDPASACRHPTVEGRRLDARPTDGGADRCRSAEATTRAAAYVE